MSRDGADKTRVSVIVPNYNGARYLLPCLESLMEQDVRRFEIIVVDDASTDGSVEEAMERYPEGGKAPGIRYLRHEKNTGFAAAVNDGIAAARSPYVLLLNNDTTAATDFVRQMWRAIRGKEELFSVSARMVSMADPGIIDDTGDDYCALGWAYTRGKDRPASEYGRARAIFAACAGAAIYRKDVLEELGGFDEAHFAYLEDIDLGYRAKLNGYRNIYRPAAVVAHAGSGSSGSRYNEFKVKLSARNNIYLIWKNMPDWQILINLPFLTAGFLIKYLFFARKGFGRIYRESIMQGFRMCKEQKKKRVDFSKIPLKRLLFIEGELLQNMLRRFSAGT